MLEQPLNRIIANSKPVRAKVIADIRRVAWMVDRSRGFSLILYLRNTGQYSISSLRKLGSWRTLCREAGVKCSRKGTVYRIVERLLNPASRKTVMREVSNEAWHNEAA